MNAREPVLTTEHILVAGVGGGGCNAVDSMTAQWEHGPALAVINTDTQALDGTRTPRRLAIGRKITNGLGTGGDAEIGRLAAEDDVEALRELFAGVQLAFVVTSLGGGTGTGAAPVVARAAQEAGALVIAFATLPFEFEGDRRVSQAKQGLARLKDEADLVIVVPNQDLFAAAGSHLSAEEAFRLSDYQLGMGVFALWKLLVTRGVINLDFAALRMVARGSDDTSVFSYGEGKGTDRATDAITAALGSPLVMGGQAVAEAECVLVSILGGPDLALREIETVMSAVRAAARKDAHLLMGAAIDLDWAGVVAVTLVVARNWNTEAAAPSPASAKTGADTAESPAPKPPGRKKKGAAATQPGLGLDRDISKGMFKDVEPTVIDGVDMDIPTFIRRRVTIEK
jgi:cell division protein FtsZ